MAQIAALVVFGGGQVGRGRRYGHRGVARILRRRRAVLLQHGRAFPLLQVVHWPIGTFDTAGRKSQQQKQ